MKNRLFIALNFPSDVINNVIEIRDKIYNTTNKVKWETENKLHITLKFLGDVDIQQNNKIIELLEKLLKYETALKLNFSKFGFFYKDNKPKILWLGIKRNDKLIKLQKKIDMNFENIGFESEKRKFNPHLTILRIKGNEDLIKLREFPDYKFSERNILCNKIFLIESNLLPSGSIYKIIKIFELNF